MKGSKRFEFERERRFEAEEGHMKNQSKLKGEGLFSDSEEKGGRTPREKDAKTEC